MLHAFAGRNPPRGAPGVMGERGRATRGRRHRLGRSLRAWTQPLGLDAASALKPSRRRRLTPAQTKTNSSKQQHMLIREQHNTGRNSFRSRSRRRGTPCFCRSYFVLVFLLRFFGSRHVGQRRDDGDEEQAPDKGRRQRHGWHAPGKGPGNP